MNGGMLPKLPVDYFEWRKDMLMFDEDFIKNSDEDSETGYIFRVGVKYPKQPHESHSDLPFLLEIMKET